MSNNHGMRQQLKQKAKGFQDQLKEHTDTMARVLMGVEKRFSTVNNTLKDLGRVINALVEVVGTDAVSAKVREHLEAEIAENSAKQIALLEHGLTNKYYTPTDKVVDDSLIVGVETAKDGTVLGGGRVQFYYSDQKSEAFQAALLGSTVGTKLQLESGGSMEIMEIYAVDVEQARKVMVEEAKKINQAMKEAPTEELPPVAVSTVVVEGVQPAPVQEGQ